MEPEAVLAELQALIDEERRLQKQIEELLLPTLRALAERRDAIHQQLVELVLIARRNKLTTRTLADSIGVSPTTISNWVIEAGLEERQ